MFWSDNEEVLKRNSRLNPFQLVNHFPGMASICRKDFLGNNLEEMRKQLPGRYSFFPRTWMLPRDLMSLAEYMQPGGAAGQQLVKGGAVTGASGAGKKGGGRKGNKKEKCAVRVKVKAKTKTLIVKPRMDSQGNGICLVQDLSRLDPTSQVVVQE
jgi:hypothetical protein